MCLGDFHVNKERTKEIIVYESGKFEIEKIKAKFVKCLFRQRCCFIINYIDY